MSRKIEQQVQELMAPLAKELGYELYDVTFQKGNGETMLDILIEKDGGVTLNDCEAMSRRAEVLLDQADPIEESYCLCVSSPGADRLLRTGRHFQMSLGKEIEVRLYRRFEGNNLHIGKLQSVTDDKITIIEKTHQLSIPRELIATARQYVKF